MASFEQRKFTSFEEALQTDELKEVMGTIKDSQAYWKLWHKYSPRPLPKFEKSYDHTGKKYYAPYNPQKMPSIKNPCPSRAIDGVDGEDGCVLEDGRRMSILPCREDGEKCYVWYLKYRTWKHPRTSYPMFPPEINDAARDHTKDEEGNYTNPFYQNSEYYKDGIYDEDKAQIREKMENEGIYWARRHPTRADELERIYPKNKWTDGFGYVKVENADGTAYVKHDGHTEREVPCTKKDTGGL